MLKKRIELLEEESSELADRLVRGQVSRAEEEECSYALQSELNILRRSHLEVCHQLENANEEVRGLSLRLQENVSKNYRIDNLCIIQKGDGLTNPQIPSAHISFSMYLCASYRFVSQC